MKNTIEIPTRQYEIYQLLLLNPEGLTSRQISDGVQVEQRNVLSGLQRLYDQGLLKTRNKKNSRILIYVVRDKQLKVNEKLTTNRPRKNRRKSQKDVTKDFFECRNRTSKAKTQAPTSNKKVKLLPDGKPDLTTLKMPKYKS